MTDTQPPAPTPTPAPAPAPTPPGASQTALSPDPAFEAQSRRRFLALTLWRFAGALGIIFGLVVNAGRVSWIGPDIAGPLGIAMVIAGAVIMVAVIPALLRRWRSDRP